MAFDVTNAICLGSGAFGDVYAVDDVTAVKRVFIGQNPKRKQLITDEVKLMLDLKM